MDTPPRKISYVWWPFVILVVWLLLGVVKAIGR